MILRGRTERVYGKPFVTKQNVRSMYRRTSKTYVWSINVRFERTFGVITTFRTYVRDKDVRFERMANRL